MLTMLQVCSVCVHLPDLHSKPVHGKRPCKVDGCKCSDYRSQKDGIVEELRQMGVKTCRQ